MSSSIAARTFVAGGAPIGPPLRPLPERTGTPALRGLPIDPARAYFYWELPESAAGPYRLQVVDDGGAPWLETDVDWQIGEYYVSSVNAARWLEATLKDARGLTLRSGRVPLPPDRPGRDPVRWAAIGDSPDTISPVSSAPSGWNGTPAEPGASGSSGAIGSQYGTTASPGRWGTP